MFKVEKIRHIKLTEVLRRIHYTLNFAVSGVFFHSGAVIQPTVAAIVCWALTNFEMTVALFQIDMRSIPQSW